MAQAVSRPRLTPDSARDSARVCPRGICGGQVALGQVSNIPPWVSVFIIYHEQ
jgi:hypothetical protein